MYNFIEIYFTNILYIFIPLMYFVNKNTKYYFSQKMKVGEYNEKKDLLVVLF